jgi:PAS domain S-box-containing protein
VKIGFISKGSISPKVVSRSGFLLDLNEIVQSLNQGAEKMFGYSPEEMIGAITRIIPSERQEERSRFSPLRRSERCHHFETVRVRKDCRQLWVSLTVSPIKDETGKVIGASKIARDITDRKHR